MELIGIPHRLVVGDKGLDQGVLEYKGRRDADLTLVPIAEVLPFLRERLTAPGTGSSRS